MKYILLFLVLISTVYAACDGCLLNGKCVEVGVQRLTEENGYEVYCGEDKVVYQAKDNNENCKYDYECLSYYCEEEICKDLRKSDYGVFMWFFGIGILIILCLGLVYFIFKGRRKTTKTIVKGKSVRKYITKGVVRKKVDPLEESIKKSLDNVSSIFKKR